MRWSLQLAQELRRRKVYRAVAWYVAGAVAVWQTADVAFPALGFPPAAMTLLVVGAIAGLPLVIGLSWAFDLRREAAEADGERRQSAVRLAAVIGGTAAVLSFAGLTTWAAWLPPRDSAESTVAVSSNEIVPLRIEQLTFTGTADPLGQGPRVAPGGELVAYMDWAADGPALFVRDLSSDAPAIDLGVAYGDFAWSADGSELLIYGRARVHERMVAGILAFPRLGGGARIVAEREPPADASMSNAAERVTAGIQGRCLYRAVLMREEGRVAVVCEHLDGRGGADTASVLVPPGEVEVSSIAPDGAHVLAIARRAGTAVLYLLSAHGAAPHPLLEGEVRATAWAGVGRALALRPLTEGDEIVELELGPGSREGTARRVWLGQEVSVFDVSKDGARLVFTKSQVRTQVWFHRIEAGRLAEGGALTRGTANSWDPAVDPGSGRVAFVRRGDVHVVADSGGAIERLTTLAGASARLPAWSSDGRRLAFVIGSEDAEEVGILEVQSRRLTRLSTRVAAPISGLGWDAADHLVLLEWQRRGAREFAVRHLAPAEGEVRTLFTGAGHLQPRLAFSPEGDRVAVGAMGRSVTLVATESGSARTLVPEESGAPIAWTRDGALVLEQGFRRVEDRMVSDLLVVDTVDGGVIRRLSRPESCGSLSMSADADRLACIRTEMFRDLWLIDGIGAIGLR